MTKDSNKEVKKELTAEEKEIKQFREVEKILIDVWNQKIGVCHHVDMILEWHKSECKRFALECVPEQYGSINYPEGSDGGKLMLLNKGFNVACKQMIKNIGAKSK